MLYWQFYSKEIRFINQKKSFRTNTPQNLENYIKENENCDVATTINNK